MNRQADNERFNKILFGGTAIFLVVVIAVAAFLWTPTSKERTSPKKEFAEYSEDLVKKANSGDAEAQYSLGNCYFYGFGVDKNLREAVKWLTKAAEQGHTRAQNDLGHCYYSGAGVERNKAEAEKWWDMASKNDK